MHLKTPHASFEITHTITRMKMSAIAKHPTIPQMYSLLTHMLMFPSSIAFSKPSGFARRFFCCLYGNSGGNYPFISHPIKFRRAFMAAVITENEPAAGSTIISPSLLTAAMSLLCRFMGFWWVCFPL